MARVLTASFNMNDNKHKEVMKRGVWGGGGEGEVGQGTQICFSVGTCCSGFQLGSTEWIFLLKPRVSGEKYLPKLMSLDKSLTRAIRFTAKIFKKFF